MKNKYAIRISLFLYAVYRILTNNLSTTGNNLQIKDSIKTYSIYVDSQSISRSGKKGWIWFRPDTIDTVARTYTLTVGKNTTSVNDSSIFTKSNFIVSSDFNDPVNPVDSIYSVWRLTPAKVNDRCKTWYGNVNQNWYNQSNIPGLIGGQFGFREMFDGFKYSYVDYGDVVPINGTSKLSGWVIATQDTVGKSAMLLLKENFITGNRFQVGTNAGDGLFIQLGSMYANYQYSLKVSNGIPFFIYFEYDGTQSTNDNKLKLFINGDSIPLVFHGNVPNSLSSDMSGTALTVSSNDLNWKGTIDDFSLADTTFGSAYGKALYKMFMQDSVTWQVMVKVGPKQLIKKSSLRINTRL